jgi:hypothetical protein
MTFDERVHVVAKKGLTERQARCLTTVMLHTGVCVPRQYARFCGIVYGEKTRKFFAKLVRLQYASMYDCRHNRARIYHVNQRALYAAIGEADGRFRKPVTLNHAIQRLMVLDAIVEHPDLVWLGTADEKAVGALGGANTDRASGSPSRQRRRGRGSHCPVLPGSPADRYSSRRPRRHRVRVVPPHFLEIAQRSKKVVWNQLLTPLRTDLMNELRWYFEQVRSHPTPSRSNDLDERFFEAREAFAAPRFEALYKAWKQDGEVALPGAGSALSAMLSTLVRVGSRPLNSVTVTVISSPWLPSPESVSRLRCTARILTVFFTSNPTRPGFVRA